jgi:hypothetical protein
VRADSVRLRGQHAGCESEEEGLFEEHVVQKMYGK